MSWSQLDRAIKALNETEFISELVFPENCETYQLPKLVFKHMYPKVTTKSYTNHSAQIKKQIDNNSPVFWTYFPVGKDSSMSHVTLIVGYREGEFLVSDSTLSEKKWIKEVELLDKAREYDSKSTCFKTEKDRTRKTCSNSLAYLE